MPEKEEPKFVKKDEDVKPSGRESKMGLKAPSKDVTSPVKAPVTERPVRMSLMER